MKKALLLIGTIAMLGAGCSQQTVTQTPSSGADTDIGSSSSTPSGQSPAPAAAVGDLKELPAVDTSSASATDEATWSKTVLKIGVTLTAPTKGANAPTWTYTLLANDDPHLKGNCFVTDATVYTRTNFAGLENACLTTTALDAGPGTRTDYFVFHKATAVGSEKAVLRTHMFTFTKTYPKGFDMNGYTATLEKIIGLID